MKYSKACRYKLYFFLKIVVKSPFHNYILKKKFYFQQLIIYTDRLLKPLQQFEIY